MQPFTRVKHHARDPRCLTIRFDFNGQTTNAVCCALRSPLQLELKAGQHKKCAALRVKSRDVFRSVSARIRGKYTRRVMAFKSSWKCICIRWKWKRSISSPHPTTHFPHNTTDAESWGTLPQTVNIVTVVTGIFCHAYMFVYLWYIIHMKNTLNLVTEFGVLVKLLTNTRSKYKNIPSDDEGRCTGTLIFLAV